jgi:hypothetical protein
MKLPGVVVFALIAGAPLPAQYYSVGGFGNIAFPALGHAPAGGNPWGNVVTPAIPQGAAAFSNVNAAANRGGLIPGFRTIGNGNGSRRNRSSSIYAFPAYIGGYGYGYGYGNGYSNGYASDQTDQSQSNGAAPPQAQPPVVINQYFGTPPPDQGPPPEAAADSNFHVYQAPANDETSTPDPASYYLIAFKDHTIYSAVAYYTDGDTLHYFTSGNVHNQVSLSLVDRALTEQLNRDRNVAVRLP